MLDIIFEEEVKNLLLVYKVKKRKREKNMFTYVIFLSTLILKDQLVIKFKSFQKNAWSSDVWSTWERRTLLLASFARESYWCCLDGFILVLLFSTCLIFKQSIHWWLIHLPKKEKKLWKDFNFFNFFFNLPWCSNEYRVPNFTCFYMDKYDYISWIWKYISWL